MAAFVVNVGGGSGGKQIIANRLKGTGTEPLNIQWGSSGTAAAATDTALGSTTGATESRTAGTSSIVTTTNTSDTYQVVGTITATGTPTVQEVGLFDAIGTGNPPTGGNFFLHANHGSTVLAVGETITYTIKVQFT